MAEPMAGGRIGYGLRSVVRHSLATLLATTALGVVAARAVDGTWAGGSSDWTNGTNWSSNPVVPDGTATFTNTGSTAVDNNNGVVVIGTVQFTSIAQAYSITIGKPFTVNAAGIVNNSGTTQNFEVTSGNNLVFQNSSTARGGVGAGAVIITNDAGGQIDFFTSASAGSATINNLASATLNFHNTTTAATSTITNDGTVNFDGSSTGGSARFVNNVGGTVDISGLTSTGMTAGSIEGAGNYVLGAKTLTTGSLNTSTQVDGVISGIGGGLTKVGTGTMTLTGLNSYTGATTISAGTLAISGFGSIASSSIV